VLAKQAIHNPAELKPSSGIMIHLSIQPCYRLSTSVTVRAFSLSLSVLMAIFPVEPRLAGTRMSAFWILLELQLYEVVMTTGAIRRAKLQLNLYHQHAITRLFLHARCPSCP